MCITSFPFIFIGVFYLFVFIRLVSLLSDGTVVGNMQAVVGDVLPGEVADLTYHHACCISARTYATLLDERMYLATLEDTVAIDTHLDDGGIA